MKLTICRKTLQLMPSTLKHFWGSALGQPTNHQMPWWSFFPIIIYQLRRICIVKLWKLLNLIFCVWIYFYFCIDFFYWLIWFSLYLLCCCLQITQFLDSHGFLDYLERVIDSDENNYNLLDKLQDAIGRGQNPISVLPSSWVEPEIITISDPDVGILGKFEVLMYINLWNWYKYISSDFITL